MLQQAERFQIEVKQYSETISKMPDGQAKLEATRLLNDLIYEVKNKSLPCKTCIKNNII